jgi:hypothetical protein
MQSYILAGIYNILRDGRRRSEKSGIWVLGKHEQDHARLKSLRGIAEPRTDESIVCRKTFSAGYEDLFLSDLRQHPLF